MNYKNMRVAPERNKLPRFVHTFFKYVSYCRILIEPIIRRHFGKRYFPFWKALLILCALACWPLIVKKDLLGLIWNLGDVSATAPLSDKQFWYRYGTWYVYLALLFVCCIPSKFEAGKGNGAKSPNYAGDLHRAFYLVKIKGRRLSLWVLEIICEPAVFMLCGFLLWKMGQSIGPVMMICAAGYSISYVCAYLITEADALDRISTAVDGKRFGEKIAEDIPDASMKPPHGRAAAHSEDDEIEDVL